MHGSKSIKRFLSKPSQQKFWARIPPDPLKRYSTKTISIIGSARCIGLLFRISSQLIGRLHGLRGRRRRRIRQTHAVRNLGERGLVLPASGQKAFMLPGGCGRHKAARPGSRCRCTIVFGDGDDAVGVAETVAEFVVRNQFDPRKPLTGYAPRLSAHKDTCGIRTSSTTYNIVRRCINLANEDTKLADLLSLTSSTPSAYWFLFRMPSGADVVVSFHRT